jgi:hypothetical protein
MPTSVVRSGQHSKCPPRGCTLLGRTRRYPLRVSQAASPKRVRVDGVPNLYQRPADHRYEVGYTGSDGKWHIKTLAARNLTEAKAELRQVLGKRDQRQDVAPRRLTLNEVADEFFAAFESKVTRGERSPSTLTNYRIRWDTHIRPTFGRRQIQSCASRTCRCSRSIFGARRIVSER